MAPILRYAPGERVEIADQYVLVGHYGEPTGIRSKWLNEGELFPLLGVPSEAGPLWYVQLHEAAVATQAA
jgi:hypothetical protein